MINFPINKRPPKKYDLLERTTNFGKAVIRLCKSIPKDPISMPLISQIVRSGTSVGANYAEANNASSKRDFRNKIFICKKEAEETKHWLAMIREYLTKPNEELESLAQETQELIMIFQKICSSIDQ